MRSDPGGLQLFDDPGPLDIVTDSRNQLDCGPTSRRGNRLVRALPSGPFLKAGSDDGFPAPRDAWRAK